jgi:hypothetical protein
MEVPAVILALLLQATAPTACATPVPPPPALVGWDRTVPVVAGGDVVVGQAYTATLQPVGTVRFVVAPERAAKPDSMGGVVDFRVASAGTYRVALDTGVWIDVVQDGKVVASATHGHGPQCSGIRKMVDFKLAPGRYDLQLSGAAKPAVRVMVARVGS